MNNPVLKNLCQQTIAYYHDIVFGTTSIIPDHVINHVENCLYCQLQLEDFKHIMSPAENDYEHEQATSIMTEILSLHFSYSQREVNCPAAKQFLPSLAIPSLEIKIPTPITVHIDKCGLCSNDLASIRRLNLSRRQLFRFSEFLADKQQCCSSADEKKKKAAQIVAALDWEIIDARTLKHICKCPSCSERLYQQRQRILENISICGRQIPCDAILLGGFFDYVLPYGINPAKDEYTKLREPFVSHILKCTDCLAKMQQLHRIIYNVEQRPDSGVVTVFSEDNSRKNQIIAGADELYQGFPVKVETVKENAPAVVNFHAAKQTKAKSLFGLKLTAGVAAAIFMIIGLTLFFHNTVTAELTPSEKTHHALQNASNVHIMQFSEYGKKSISERWRSKVFKFVRTTDYQKDALYDISRKIQKIRYRNTGKIEISPLLGEKLKNIEMFAKIRRGQDDSTFSSGESTWNYITDKVPSVPNGIEVYENLWESKDSNGSVVINKRRIFVYSNSFLPQKIESYQRFANENDFTLGSVHIYEYPTDEQFKAALNF